MRRSGGVTAGVTPLGMMTGGTTPADLNAFVFRPRMVLESAAFAAPIRRMSLGGSVATMKYMMTMEELAAAVEAQKNAEKPEPDHYVNILYTQLDAQRRHLLADGWAYFKNGDSLRSRGAFVAAEEVDARSPIPRFGQLVVDFERSHFRRGMTTLARIMSYDAIRRPGQPGILEYNVSLQAAFQSDDHLKNALLKLRRFAQKNLQNAPVQALYCYALWYSRYPAGMLEAEGVALRLKRTAPGTPWAGLYDQLQRAKQLLKQRAATEAAAAAAAAATAATADGPSS